MVFNVKEQLEPYLQRLKKTQLTSEQIKYVNIIEDNLGSLLSPLITSLADRFKYSRLTPDEIHIANLIAQGKKSQEIADMIGITKRTVSFHREKIRDKMGVTNTSKSLKQALNEII